ncbi:MAG: hypothetical protein JWO80_4089 [Bryobacterales bacterium]|nr:hypothetical protein [Bryobacterales bacterium]
MGLAQDLLQQASHLATYEGSNPSQAALRRAVSTAYYALFHLVVEDAGRYWQGSVAAVTGVERALNHGPMKNSSIQFTNSNWTDWHDITQPVPPPLRSVARAFIELQEERHAADYNNHEQWTVTEVQTLLNTAAEAFRDWLSIRTHPMAGNYLLSMLLGKQR